LRSIGTDSADSAISATRCSGPKSYYQSGVGFSDYH